MSISVEKCLQAWTNSLKQMKAKADIVFFGDSLTFYGDFSGVFPDKVVCNLGLRGDTIQGMIDRVGQVKMLDSSVVYVMAGINDVGRKPIDVFETSYKELVDVLAGIHVVLQSILPVNTINFRITCDNDQILKFNSRIQAIAKEKGCDFVDLFSLYEENGQLPLEMTRDGIHLIEAAYHKWYNAIRNTSVFTLD